MFRLMWTGLSALSCCGLALSLEPPQQQHTTPESWKDIHQSLSLTAPDLDEKNDGVSLRRSLAMGDFEAFNQLIRESVIRLPDAQISEKVAFIQLTLDLSNIRCTGLQVGDIVINFNRESAQRFGYEVDILDMDLTCSLDYLYDYGVLNGRGSVEAYTSRNYASTRLAFTSPNFNQYPPNGSVVDSCSTDVEIDDLDFSGDFISRILDTFERLIRNRLEREIGDVACEELGSLGTTLVSGMLDLAQEKLQPYLEPLSGEITNPLYAENNLVIPSDVTLVDLIDTETSVVSKWLNQALEEASALIGSEAEDEESGGRDLGINVLLRSYLLDQEGAFTLELDELPFETDGILFDGHDKLTETTITFQRMRLYGLDSFSKFAPILSIGKHTIQVDLSWDFLTVELDATVDIKPSTLPDAIIEEPKDTRVVENIKIKFGVENVDAVISFLLALDEDKLASLELGTLFFSDQILSCLLPVLVDTQFTGLDIKIGDVQEPELDDFVSEGIDRIVTNSVEAAFAMYKPVVLQAVPSLFQTTLRDILNQKILDSFLNVFENGCSPIQDSNGLVDFRNLLLLPNEAEQAGGTNLQPYGDLPPKLAQLIRNQYFSASDDGVLNINELLVAPMTESRSGVAGMLKFPSAAYTLTEDPTSDSWIQSSLQNFEFSLTNARIQNLDTMMLPVSALQPTDRPHVLSNMITMGTQEDPLNMTLTLLLAVDPDQTSPLSMFNEIDISASIAQTSINANLFAAVREKGLLGFPLRDLLNFNCWLATIQAPVLGHDGVASNVTFGITEMVTSLSDLNFGMNCIRCTSEGLDILPDVLSTLKDAGVPSVLEKRLGDMVADIAGSKYVQALVDGTLVDAAQRCPHSPEYTETPVSVARSTPGFPEVSYDSLETIVFAAAEVLKVGAVVVSKTHAGYTLEQADPLSGQKELNVPSDTRLLDFADLGSVVGSWADTAINSLNDYLLSSVDVVGSDGGLSSGRDLQVNSLVRSIFLDKDNVLSMAFDDINLGTADMELALSKLNIVGLDSITDVKALNIIGAQTLRNNVGWRRLSMEVIITINKFGGAGSRRFLESAQEITLAFELKDVEASLGLLMALDLDLMGSLELSSILEIRNMLPCLLSAARAASLTEAIVSVGSVQGLSVTGFKSDEVSQATSESSRIIMEQYGDLFASSLPGLFDVTLRSMANNWISYYMNQQSNVACPSKAVESTGPNFVDFRELFLSETMSSALGGSGTSKYGDLFRTVVRLLNDLVFKIDPIDGSSDINEVIIAPLTRAQSNVTGTVKFPVDLFDEAKRVQVGGLDARIQLRAWEARIENLDTFGEPLTWLDPIINEPHQLNNTATLGAGDRPLRLAVRFLIVLSGDDGLDMRNDLDISLNLHTANAIVQALIRMTEERFFSFPLRDLLDLNCWLATMPAPELDARGVKTEGSISSLALANLAISLAELKPNITCVSCTSPGIYELAELISAPEASEDITDIANRMLDYVTQLMGGTFLQLQLDRLLNEAARKCPHSPMYEVDPKTVNYEPLVGEPSEPSIAYLITIGFVVLGLLFAVGILVLVIRCGVRNRHKNWVQTLPNHQTHLILGQQEREQELEAELNAMTESMFRSSDIPLLVRWSMPVIIIGNIAFFLSGHLSLGGTVDIEGEFAGEKIRFEKFFEFSMAQSGIDIWKAGGVELAFLLLIFSGIWPYTKQLMSLALWFLPPSALPVSKRGSILLWLDYLAKWSMIDVFVLVVTIAAFRVSILSPDLQFLPEGFYNINLMVVPLWGLYANMTAQLISQVSSHFIVHYHRRIVDKATAACRERNGLLDDAETVCADEDQTFVSPIENEPMVSARENEHEKLCRHAFLRPHRGESDKLVIRNGVSAGLAIMSIVLATCVVVGCAVPTFSLDILGIIGVAVESGQGFEAAKTHHSLFSVLKLLIDQARFLDYAGGYVGLGSLSALVVLSVLIVPILQTLLLLRQWFASSTRKSRARLAIFTEILQAWQYAEVYLLSIFVASWQLGPVSEFMINSYCDSLRETFAELVYYGVLAPEDAQCFRVETRIESGSFILLAGAILLALLNTFVTRAVVQYFRDKQDEDRLIQEGTTKVDDTTLYSLDETALKKIHPVPVLFTDFFRWVLRREDGVEGTRGWVLRRQDDASNGTGSNLASYRASNRGSINSSRASTKMSSTKGSNHFERSDPDFDSPEFMPMTQGARSKTMDDAGSQTTGTMTRALSTSKEEASLCYSASVAHNTAPDVDLDGSKAMPLPDDDDYNDYDYETVEDTLGEYEEGTEYQKDGFEDEHGSVEGTLASESQLLGDDLQTVGSNIGGREPSLARSGASQRSLESRRRSDDELLADAIHAVYGKKGDSIDEM